MVPRPRILARVAAAAGDSTRRARESGRPRYLEEEKEEEKEGQDEEEEEAYTWPGEGRSSPLPPAGPGPATRP